MKKLLASALIYTSLCVGNYFHAIHETKNCEGSDLAIEKIMTAHGFTGDIFAPVTAQDILTPHF